jgi:cytochrome c
MCQKNTCVNDIRKQRNVFIMSMESNKILAALLVAGIIASSSGFIAEKIMGSHDGGKVVMHKVEAATASAPEVAEPVLALIAGVDPKRGEKLSRACASCHTFDKGGKNGSGPNIWNAVGSPKSSNSEFAYSKALQEFGGHWSYDELNKFLWKPKKYIKGTKMNFVGIKKPADRAAMIAWLRTLADNPAPLPSAAEIAAEAASAE